MGYYKGFYGDRCIPDSRGSDDVKKDSSSSK